MRFRHTKLEPDQTRRYSQPEAGEPRRGGLLPQRGKGQSRRKGERGEQDPIFVLLERSIDFCRLDGEQCRQAQSDECD